MRIQGVTLAEFSACVRDVSNGKYSGNGIVHPDSHAICNDVTYRTGPVPLPSRNQYGQFTRMHGLPRQKPACSARTAVLDSRGPGARTAAFTHPGTGNRTHGRWACWHFTRDVLDLMFTRFPNAVARSGIAWTVTYRGREGFLDTYPATASRNVGSQLSRITMPELCQCDEDGPHAEPFRAAERARRRRTVQVPEHYAVVTEPDYETESARHQREHQTTRSAERSRELEEAEAQLKRSAALLADDTWDVCVFGPPPSARHALCEVEGCLQAAQECECGNAHCYEHPHVLYREI